MLTVAGILNVALVMLVSMAAVGKAASASTFFAGTGPEDAAAPLLNVCAPVADRPFTVVIKSSTLLPIIGRFATLSAESSAALFGPFRGREMSAIHGFNSGAP